MSTLDLSLCLLNWNTKDLLRGCLRSLLDTQQGFNGTLEIIVADNASEDGSADMVRREFPRVNLIQNQRNLLFAAGNNVAARHASGRYLLFLNSDTLVDCAELGKMVAFLDEHPRAGACGPAELDSQGRVQNSRPPPYHSPWYLLCGLVGLSWKRFFPPLPADRAVSVPWISGACLMVRRSLFEDVGGFDERFPLYGNDNDLCAVIRRSGHEVWYLPHCSFVHLGGGSSGRVDSAYLRREAAQAQLTLLTKHYRPLWAALLRFLFVAAAWRRVLTRGLLVLLSWGRSEKRKRRFREALAFLGAVREARKRPILPPAAAGSESNG